MSILIEIGINVLIMAAIILGLFSGYRRGLILIALEVISFAIATAIALGSYHWVGVGLKTILHLTIALGNVTAFVLLWTIVEIICALIIRFTVLPHLSGHLKPSRSSRLGGAALDAFKTTAIITLSLIIFAGLPLSASTKRPVTGAFLARQLLAASGNLPAIIAAGLGHDLNNSLNVFTITAEPESEQRIELGYTTTKVSVDEAAETTMLTMLNHERTSRGLPALSLNSEARSVARSYAADMFARGYFSHLSLEGKSPFDRMRAAGIHFGSAGENLALAPTLQLAHSGLMKSPGHRANILSTSYHTVGIGVIDGGPYGLMIAQEFTD